MIDGVEEAFDVLVQHPSEPPAALTRRGNRLVRRPTWPVAIRVSMEVRLELWLQTMFDHHLCHSVRNRWDSQWPRAASCLRYFNSFDWRGLIAARGQAIPEFIEIVCHLCFKLLDRLSINSRCA